MILGLPTGPHLQKNPTVPTPPSEAREPLGATQATCELPQCSSGHLGPLPSPTEKGQSPTRLVWELGRCSIPSFPVEGLGISLCSWLSPEPHEAVLSCTFLPSLGRRLWPGSLLLLRCAPAPWEHLVFFPSPLEGELLSPSAACLCPVVSYAGFLFCFCHSK